MALIQCKECSQQVSDTAQTCPSCGAKVPKKTSVAVKAIAWFFGIGFVLMIIGGLFSEDQPVTSSQNNQTQRVSPTPNSIKENWTYQTKKDEMRNSETKFAITDSSNKVDFEFPYNGGSILSLIVRKNSGGNDVYITISKGQFLCSSFDDCEVGFRFDDDKIMSVTMVGSDSHDSDVLFVKLDSTENKVINRLKTSKKLIIEPKFYQHGNAQFSFNVDGFKPI